MSIKSRKAAKNQHSPAEKDAYWSMRYKKNLERELKSKVKQSLTKGTFAQDFPIGPIDSGLIDF